MGRRAHDGDARDAQRETILKALARLCDELERLAAAVAEAGDLTSLLAALKAREQRRDELRAQLAGVENLKRVSAVDVRQLERQARAAHGQARPATAAAASVPADS
jgi:hypothetical protein